MAVERIKENPIQLVSDAEFRWDPESLLKSGLFELMYHSPVEMQLDSVAADLFARVREGRVKRVVVDALGDLRNSSSDRRRVSDFIYALTQWFAVQNVTCMIMSEIPNLYESAVISDDEISNMSDNVVVLRFTRDPEMVRAIPVIKTRGSAHDHREHKFEISSRGVLIDRSA